MQAKQADTSTARERLVAHAARLLSPHDLTQLDASGFDRLVAKVITIHESYCDIPWYGYPGLSPTQALEAEYVDADSARRFREDVKAHWTHLGGTQGRPSYREWGGEAVVWE